MTPRKPAKPEVFPGTLIRRIPEQKIPGKRLGRHVRHDPRSLAYQVKPLAALAKTVLWQRSTPVLDQGNVGACTGFSTAGVLGTAPFYGTLTDLLTAGLVLDGDEALRLYATATTLDTYRGTFTYPPVGGQDSGSDGLSVAKAAQQAGMISGYLHCTSIDAVITALQAGAVITGVSWWDSFDQPDSSGRVSISPNASVRGGHEFEVNGVDMDAKTFHAVNSWGASWGDHGSFSFSFDTYARLLADQGDATAFVPITSAPPQPKPVTPNAADVEFARTAGVSCKRTRPYKVWSAALGL